MKSLLVMYSAIALAAGAGQAFSEPPPSEAKKVSPEEFKAFADGKTVEVEILDMEVPVSASLLWSWSDGTITGEALINNKDKVQVSTKISFDGEKVCSQGDGDKEPNCHTIYIEGDKFYEVRDDGEVHAISTIKN